VPNIVFVPRRAIFPTPASEIARADGGTSDVTSSPQATRFTFGTPLARGGQQCWENEFCAAAPA